MLFEAKLSMAATIVRLNFIKEVRRMKENLNQLPNPSPFWIFGGFPSLKLIW